MSKKTTLAVKVSSEFARKYRRFCDEHCLLVGKFTEQVLLEGMEDRHFGLKTQAILSKTSAEPVEHTAYFGGRRRRA